ncbi:nucleotide pyrophosphohydrolase [Chryseobacterium sp.]|uniref:nucleotide pyrophosphohydrolase n=1 Tax=Chryseobacterium sp. TaxID=1871047 RepID=UPI0021D39922|nr:nucleotide pyrophosphohydrolase [Chryseobacterium sp.]
MMEDINSLITQIVNFRDERDWKQFHNSKDLALALSVEASELLELFLWKENEDFNLDKLKDELADVLMYALLLADKNNLDVGQIVLDKIKKNADKYPVDKAKGKATKYNEL